MNGDLFNAVNSRLDDIVHRLESLDAHALDSPTREELNYCMAKLSNRVDQIERNMNRLLIGIIICFLAVIADLTFYLI